MKKILLSVGESSGDLQAELVLRALVESRNAKINESENSSELQSAKNCEEMIFFAICGAKLRELKFQLEQNRYPHSRIKIEEICSIEELSVMGFSDVAKHYPKIREIYESVLALVRRENIKRVILVDYPGFNLRLAERLNSIGVECCYHIAPKFWAHGESRAHKIVKYCKSVVSILPFEADLLRVERKNQNNVGAEIFYVGNPLKDGVVGHNTQALPTVGSNPTVDVNQKVTAEFKIALIPGSRESEVRYGVPLLLKSFLCLKNRFGNEAPKLSGYLPIANTFTGAKRKWFEKVVEESFHIFSETDRKWLKRNIIFLENGSRNRTYDVFAQCDYGWIFSGTASLEATFFNLPLSVFFLTSQLNIEIAKRLVVCKYISLANLCSQDEVFPEFIQENATEHNLSGHAFLCLTNQTHRKKMKLEMLAVSNLFSPFSAAQASQIWERFTL